MKNTIKNKQIKDWSIYLLLKKYSITFNLI